MRLLANEAPIEAIRSIIVERFRDFEPLTQTELLRLTLQVRESIQELRRREYELSVLDRSAADLVSIRNTRQVLEAIVRRARGLMRTDVSYLTLVEEVGEIEGAGFTRVIDGLAYQDNRDVRAMGLGRLVLTTKSPQSTANYLADDRFEHDRRIDATFEREGLSAILGVPVTIRGSVIGVLSAAHRTPRVFDRSEVLLLSALAALAASAIENARLFESSERALSELRAAHETIRSHVQELERESLVHDRLTQLVLDGADVQDVAQVTTEWLGHAVTVTDLRGNVTAVGVLESSSDGGARPNAHGSDNQPNAHGFDKSENLKISVTAGGRSFGEVLVDRDVEKVPSGVRTLERAVQVIALMLLNEQSTLEAEQRRRGELLGHVLRHAKNAVTPVCRRAASVGVDLEKPHRLIVARAPDAERFHVLSACTELERRYGGLAGEQDGALVLILPATPNLPEIAEFGPQLRNLLEVSITAVAAGPFSALSELDKAMLDSLRALTLLESLGRTGEYSDIRDIGLFGLVFANASAIDIERFISSALGPLLAQDSARGTRLFETMEQWFAENGSLAATARNLHVHINTLYKRLERIDQLLGPSWRTDDRSLHMRLAIRLENLRNAVG